MKKSIKFLKRIGFGFLGLIALFIFAGLMGWLDEDESVFGKVTEHPVMSGSGENQVGVRGFVEANKELMTDEALIEFYNEHIAKSEYNWFTIDFGDNTGYNFVGSNFSYVQWSEDEEWNPSNGKTLGIGHIYDDNTNYIPAIEVPALETIEEYQTWADQYNITISFVNENFIGVEDGEEKTFIRVDESHTFEDDYLTIIVE